MENELKKLQDFFALIELQSFCKKYYLQYDYLRHILKGRKELSEKKYLEYNSAILKYREDLQNF